MLGSIVGNILGGVLGGGIQTGIDRGNTGRNIRFQRSMAHNKIRWAMEDMRKGGINPILAAQGGLGAGAGTGGASAQTSAAPPFSDTMMKGVSSGLQVLKTKQEIKEMQANVQQLRMKAGSLFIQMGVMDAERQLLYTQKAIASVTLMGEKLGLAGKKLDNYIKKMELTALKEVIRSAKDIWDGSGRNWRINRPHGSPGGRYDQWGDTDYPGGTLTP